MDAPLPDDHREHVDHAVAVDPSLGLHRQCFAGELVNDVEQLHRATVVGHVELKSNVHT